MLIMRYYTYLNKDIALVIRPIDKIPVGALEFHFFSIER